MTIKERPTFGKPHLGLSSAHTPIIAIVEVWYWETVRGRYMFSEAEPAGIPGALPLACKVMLYQNKWKNMYLAEQVRVSNPPVGMSDEEWKDLSRAVLEALSQQHGLNMRYLPIHLFMQDTWKE